MSPRAFAVRCGSMLKAVLAHDPEEAARLALQQFASERDGQVPARMLGKVIIVAEEGKPHDDNFMGLTQHALEQAGLAAAGLGIGTSGPFSPN